MTQRLGVVFLMLLSISNCPLLAADKKPEVSQKTRRSDTQDVEPDVESDIRTTRPFSVTLSGIGKTPFVGALFDMNLHPYFGIGAGFGYFTAGSVKGEFIPVFAQFYPLKTNFSPFVEGGVDFISVKFQSSNSLLNSTFKGTQFILGAGAEYRFDFGLLLRAEFVRFMNASVWSPGIQIGYSVEIRSDKRREQ